jgi:preprotein translocase subunit SecE
MARETRRQRRAARAAAGDGAATGRRGRQAQARPSQQPVKQQTGRKSERRGQFVRESAAELRKVDWPSRRQTFQGVVVVIIACAIVGAYLWGLDQIIRPVVDRVIL